MSRSIKLGLELREFRTMHFLGHKTLCFVEFRGLGFR